MTDKSSEMLEQLHKTILQSDVCAEALGSKWQPVTRGGYPVRIYAEDGSAPFRIHGAVYVNEGWKHVSWLSDGQYLSTNHYSDYNLMPIKKTKRVFKTLNELAKDYSFHYALGLITIFNDGTMYERDMYTDVSPTYQHYTKEWLEIFTKEIEE
jgi:hypothetical protein